MRWYGYLHINGEVKVKRTFGDYDQCVQDCQESDFVTSFTGEFDASTHEEAHDLASTELILNGA